MIDNVKIFRKVVKDMGYDDQSHYIRIRPEERDGVWRIRADAKKKNGDSKFVSVASFDIPPLDENLKNVSGWATPTWTRKTPGATRDGTTTAASANGARAAAAAADMDFTEDEEIVNL